jgi:UDP-2,4-diacetamido-2,4,6-trideoxy-beta-L-altropyranose hydrolase
VSGQPRDRSVVLLRSDAGPNIGTGHLMRQRALAEAWTERSAAVHLLTSTREPALLAPFRHLGVHIHVLPSPHPHPDDRDRVTALVAALHPSWISIDGYQFDSGYLGAVREAGCRTLLIDDMAHLDDYPVDVLVNQNAHATRLGYRVRPDTRLMLGTDYVLLRNEYRSSRPAPRAPGPVQSVLVTLGGADPLGVTSVVVSALGRLRDHSIRATIIIGAANRQRQAIEDLAAQMRPGLRVLQGVDDMRSHMANADLAIASAGSTVWELAYMGVPSLLIDTGPAERLLLAGLDEIRLFERVGSADDVSAEQLATALEARIDDPTWRSAMSERAMRVVDGHGVERVLDATSGDVP